VSSACSLPEATFKSCWFAGRTSRDLGMLCVIIPNVELGGRGDGADVAALENIRTYLESLA
jgi:hypothetical protein